MTFVCAEAAPAKAPRTANASRDFFIDQSPRFLEIDGLDEETIEALRERAKNALTTLALAKEESLGNQEPAEDLLNLEGLDRALAYRLASKGVCTLEDLAEQGVDDLTDIEGMSDEQAGALIMAARNICWFGDDA